MYDKGVVNFILNGGKLKISSRLKNKTGRECTLFYLIQ